MAYETKLPRQASSSTGTEDFSEGSEVFAPSHRPAHQFRLRPPPSSDEP